MGFTQGTHRNTRRAVWLAVAGLILSLLLVAAVSPSPAEAIQYFGKKPGKWEAEIEIRNGFIRSMHLKLPSNCRDQKHPPGLNLEINRDSKLRLRRYGGFYRESVTRWSKSVLKGRVIGNRVQGSFWFADFGDYVQCWTGTGEKPSWVRFAARAVTPK